MIVNLIPLAGKGQRFVDKGYKMPKPLIEIDGELMIFRAFASLPKSDKNIFVCSAEHIKKYGIDKTIKDKIPNSLILVDENPIGQASSSYVIKGNIDEDDILNVGACDNSMLYDMNKYEDLINDEEVDFLVWTFKDYHGVNYNPNQYSYCRVDDSDNILEISMKKPVSDNPIKDNCLVGAFTFKKAKYFLDNYLEMKTKGDTTNGELYIDNVMNYCLKNNLKGKVFVIDKYIGFGTPNDLETYNYWLNYFNKIKYVK